MRLAYPGLSVCQALRGGGQLRGVRGACCGRALLERVARGALLGQLLLLVLHAYPCDTLRFRVSDPARRAPEHGHQEKASLPGHANQAATPCAPL